MAQLTANQLWKSQKRNGQTQLDFKTWLNREKAKGWKSATGDPTVPASSLNDGIQQVINELHTEGGLQTAPNQTYIFGLPKRGLIVAGVGLVVIIAGIIVYKKLAHK